MHGRKEARWANTSWRCPGPSSRALSSTLSSSWFTWPRKNLHLPSVDRSAAACLRRRTSASSSAGRLSGRRGQWTSLETGPIGSSPALPPPLLLLLAPPLAASSSTTAAPPPRTTDSMASTMALLAVSESRSFGRPRGLGPRRAPPSRGPRLTGRGRASPWKSSESEPDGVRNSSSPVLM